MGQYYRPLIITEGKRNQTFLSHDFDSGLKLMEHSWYRNPFVNAVMVKLVDSPKRVAWIGDYSNDRMILNGFAFTPKIFEKYYKSAWKIKPLSAINIMPKVEKFIEDIDNYVLINRTKRQYIKMGDYYKLYSRNEWCTHPLSLLTACGNGLGGGDYRSEFNESFVGYWAFDLLEVKKEIPYGHVDIVSEIGFIEDWQENF